MKKFKQILSVLMAIFILFSTIPSMTVMAKDIANSTVYLTKSKNSSTIYVGNTVKFKVKGVKSGISWKTSNKKIATVNKNGTVKAIKTGKVVISAKVKKKTYKCNVVVKNVSLNKTKLTLNSNSTYTLKLNGSKISSISSSNKKVLTVNKNGTIKGLNEGSAVVTIKGTNKKKYKCNVKVKACINFSNIVLAKDDKKTIKLYGTSLKSVASSNKKVATISKAGVIKAVGKGTATITLKGKNKKSYKCTVKVEAPSLNKTSLELVIKQNYTLKLNNNTQIVKWNSDNTNVAKVSSKGVVTALNVGNANIYATVASGKKYTCKIRVISKKVNKYTVTFDSNGGSSVPSQTVEDGKFATRPATVTKNGYTFTGWYVNKNHTELFLFETEKITKNITLYANWVKNDEDQIDVSNAINQLIIEYQTGDNIDSVTKDISLPTKVENSDDINIKWVSDNTSVISNTGVVHRPDSDQNATVNLTVNVSKGKASSSAKYALTVIHENQRENDEIPNNTIVDVGNLNNQADYSIDYNDDNSQVTSIDGKFSDIVVENVDDALDTIQNNRTIIGLDNATEELAAYSISQDEYGSEYSFNQVYNDIHVFGKGATVSVDSQGVTDFLTADVVSSETLSQIDLDPDLSQSEIKNILENEYDEDATVSFGNSNLIIYPLNEFEENPILAYSVSYNGNDNDKYFDNTAIVDAQSGKIVHTYTNILDDSVVTGSGKDELNNKVSFPIQFTLTDWYFYYMYDTENKVQMYKQGIISTRVGSEFNSWSDGQQISAYVNMRNVKKWWASYPFYRNSLNNKGMKINVVTHDNRYGKNNAFWYSGDERIHITDCTGSIVKHSRAVANDVIVHESTHAVMQYDISYDFAQTYENYPGAINEGYADVFGCLNNRNWVHGEKLYNSTSKLDGVTISSTRNISNPNDSSALSKGPDRLSSSRFIDPTLEEPSDENDYNGVHTNSYLVSHAAFLMKSYGMDWDTLSKLWYKSIKMGYTANSTLFTVRKNLIKAGKELNLSDENMARIRKAFDAEEIYGETGNINIKFQDEKGRNITDNSIMVKVDIARNRKEVPQNNISKVINASSDITEKVYFGTYNIKATADGYIPFNSNIDLKESETKTFVITLIKQGQGTISGNIKSATTGLSISNATINVYKGWNNTNNNLVFSTASNSSGNYSITLSSGYYTIEILKDEYITSTENITIIPGNDISNTNFSLSPVLNLTSDFRVVLTWGQYPSDLDSHLFGQVGSSKYHVYYSNKDGYINGIHVANLDVDDTTSWGPETVTFNADVTGSYDYYIDWYSGSGTWAECAGKVDVYNGEKLIYSFNSPQVYNHSGSWRVFSYKNGIFTPYNDICSDIY